MPTAPTPGEFGGSTAQLRYITSLMAERAAEDGTPVGEHLVASLNAAAPDFNGTFTLDHILGNIDTKREASRMIDWLNTQPRWTAPRTVSIIATDRPAQPTPATDPNVPAPLGIHETADGIFRVVKSRESQNLYAKRFVNGAWEYVGRGPLGTLDESTLMSYERAVEIGQTGDWCIFGHPLEDPLSVVRGLGPTCERNHFPNAPRRTAQAKRDAEAAIQTEAGKAQARAEFLAAIRTGSLVGA